MTEPEAPGGNGPLVVAGDQELHGRLERLAREQRMVFVAGLPGTGKSLLIHQLAHLAVAAGRVVHLLQWDVARPVFEESAAGRRYPVVDGVTHGIVRKAVGLWARRALAGWERRCAAPEHLLVGETPFVGHRLIELARPIDDEAEPALAAPSCRFAIPVPSLEVRAFLEAERARRAARPVHPREREDAPPHVLRGLWRELVEVARALGLPVPAAGDDVPYDPLVYRRTYEALLRHRHVESIDVRTVLPTTALSVYAFAVPHADLAPGEAEAESILREVEARHPDPAALGRDIDRWWVV
ncbi:MAG: hypothetical protein HY294_12800 [Candidatus Rokubacteria bacterium]|nr:hypothetical protein [Candidatus Rokubacteria bacterium]MBI3826870.1 hypothetical protein [Candidatus Rokubacteria bacterium]